MREHKHLRPRRPQRQFCDSIALDCEGPQGPTARQPGQPALALLSRAGLLDYQRGQHRRQEGHWRHAASQLLAQDRKLDQAKPLTAILLGNRYPWPTQLAQLAPQILVEAPLLGVGAHPLRPRALGQKLARGALDLALVLAQAEVHQAAFNRGRPRTRSATMFLRTSVVPPSIVLPRARNSS